MKRTNIKIYFNDEKGNKYFYGKHFHNPQLKLLTIDKLIEVFYKLNAYEEITKTIRFRIFDFNYAKDFRCSLSPKELKNKNEDLIPLILKGISTSLTLDVDYENGLTAFGLSYISELLTIDELIELAEHIAYPYFQETDWYLFDKLEIIESPLGNYLKWRISTTNETLKLEGVTRLKTKTRNTTSLSDVKTAKDLRALLNDLPDDWELPNLTFKYYEDN